MHLIIKKTSYGETIEPSYNVVGTAKTYEQATKLIEAHNLINTKNNVEFHAVLFEAEPLVLKDEVKEKKMGFNEYKESLKDKQLTLF